MKITDSRTPFLLIFTSFCLLPLKVHSDSIKEMFGDEPNVQVNRLVFDFNHDVFPDLGTEPDFLFRRNLATSGTFNYFIAHYKPPSEFHSEEPPQYQTSKYLLKVKNKDWARDEIQRLVAQYHGKFMPNNFFPLFPTMSSNVAFLDKIRTKYHQEISTTTDMVEFLIPYHMKKDELFQIKKMNSTQKYKYFIDSSLKHAGDIRAKDDQFLKGLLTDIGRVEMLEIGQESYNNMALLSANYLHVKSKYNSYLDLAGRTTDTQKLQELQGILEKKKKKISDAHQVYDELVERMLGVSVTVYLI